MVHVRSPRRRSPPSNKSDHHRFDLGEIQPIPFDEEVGSSAINATRKHNWLSQSHLKLATIVILSIALVYIAIVNHRLRYQYISAFLVDASSRSKDEVEVNPTPQNGSLPIAWLMSFPNSGTTYTSFLVRAVSGYNTASNYGVVDDDGKKEPFNDMPEGPFFTMGNEELNAFDAKMFTDPIKKEYARPQRGYILTKTHCGSYCKQCIPNAYITTARQFSKKCSQSLYVTENEQGELKTLTGSYSTNLVERAVHLIRNPFDNIVARFHYELKKTAAANKTLTFPKSREGFRAMCKELNDRYYDDVKNDRFYDDVKNDRFYRIPCYSDFFRYIQWHNLAFTTTSDLDIPTMILNYENYTNDFNRTKDSLLAFLQQENNNVPPLFVTGKTYREYFTKKEIDAVSTMFSKLALDKTWKYTRHYFEQ